MSIPVPVGLAMRTTMSRNSPVAGLGIRARTTHLFQPQAFDRGRQSAHHVAQFVTLKIERRPHV